MTEVSWTGKVSTTGCVIVTTRDDADFMRELGGRLVDWANQQYQQAHGGQENVRRMWADPIHHAQVAVAERLMGWADNVADGRGWSDDG